MVRRMKIVVLIAGLACIASACSAVAMNEATDAVTGGRGETPVLASQAATTDGCAPSSMGELTDDGFVPVAEQRGLIDHPFGIGATRLTSIDDPQLAAIDVKAPPNGPSEKPLREVLWVPEENAVSLVYSPADATVGLSTTEFLRTGGIVLIQLPFAGQDAKTVLSAVTRNVWEVDVGTHPAALVWGDPVAEDVRPFGLYWADGESQWVLRGAVAPDELINLARSIYC